MEDTPTLEIRDGRLVEVEGNEIHDIGAAVWVKAYTTNVDTDEITVDLEFVDNGKRVTKTLSRKDITERGLAKLTQYGADTWKENAAMYVIYVRGMLNEVKRTYQHSQVGWREYEGVPFFKLDLGVGFESKYVGEKYKIAPKGSLEAWLHIVKTEVLGRPWLEFALAAGFTAPLLRLIAEVANMDSLFINFTGASSTGKTLATRLAVSPFGLPDMFGNGLMKSWFSTDQGLMHELVGNFGVPIIIDDTSSQDGNKDFTNTIYRIVLGMEKAALKSDGTKREQGEWMTTIFSSSEKSILQSTDQRSGIRVRFFEISQSKITDSAENAERIERAILQNYGHAGIKYVEKLLELGQDVIVSRWEQVREEMAELLPTDNLTRRIAGKLAVVRLAGELANEALGLGLRTEQLTDSLVELEKVSYQTRDVGVQAYEYLMQYMNSNPNKFFQESQHSDAPWRDIIGRCTKSNGRITEVRIPKDPFHKLLSQGKFDVEQTLHSWKEKGLLSHDKGKITPNRVFQPGMAKIPMYAIKVVDLEQVLGDGPREVKSPAQNQPTPASESVEAAPSESEAETEHRRPIALRKG